MTVAPGASWRHELARDAVSSKTRRLQALTARRREPRDSSNVITLPTALSGTADSLAGDYTRLAKEICDRIGAAETAEDAPSARRAR